MEPLQHLIAVKRHEQPPPGYFNHFSGRVIAQIENDRSRAPARWWHWVEETFQIRPILACLGSVAVVATSVFGYGLTGLIENEIANSQSVHGLDRSALASRPRRALTEVESFSSVVEPVAPQYPLGLRPAFAPEVPSLHFRNGNFGMQMVGFQTGR